jgi:hypothetical protein
MSDHTTPAPKDIASLVRRFVKARWIHGAIVTTVADGPFSIVWTRKGQQRMAQLHGMTLKLRQLPKQHGWIARLMAHWWWLRFIVLSGEVQRPALSVSERWALVGIAETLKLGRDGLPEREYKIRLGSEDKP